MSSRPNRSGVVLFWAHEREAHRIAQLQNQPGQKHSRDFPARFGVREQPGVLQLEETCFLHQG